MPHHTQVPNIPSLIYFCRRNPGEPYISPKARTTRTHTVLVDGVS